MKKIQIYDPALCCSTGVCGVDADQALIIISADVDMAMHWQACHLTLAVLSDGKV